MIHLIAASIPARLQYICMTGMRVSWSFQGLTACTFQGLGLTIVPIPAAGLQHLTQQKISATEWKVSAAAETQFAFVALKPA